MGTTRRSTGWRVAFAVPLALFLLVGLLGSTASARSRLGHDSARSGERAATLSLQPARLPSGSTRLTLVLRNTGSRVLGYGLPYRVEQYVDGGWAPAPVDTAFALPEFGLRPRDAYRQTVRLPASLASRRYRVVKEAGPFVLRAEFVIRPRRAVGQPGYDRQEVAATLKVSPYVSTTAKVLTYEIANVGPSTFTYGAGADIERLIAGRWPSVGLKLPVPDILYTLDPGRSRQEQTALPELTPGRYRLVKPISAFVLRAEFVARGPQVVPEQ